MSEVESQPAWTATIDVSHLREFVDVAAAVVDECRLRITDDGIATDAVDPANVTIVCAELPADAFEAYNADEVEIGLNLARLQDILEHFEGHGEVTIELQQDGIQLNLQAGPFSNSMAYFDSDSVRADPDPPDLDLSAALEIGSWRLQSAIRYVDEIANHPHIGYDADDDAFYVSVEGDTDDAEFRAPREDLSHVSRAGSADSAFGCEFLMDLAEGMPENRDVAVEVGQEFPVILSFGIGPTVEGASGRYQGEARYMVAPRIYSSGDER